MMFVAESYIIAVVNGVIAFGFIMMADAPKDPTNLNSKCKLLLRPHYIFSIYLVFSCGYSDSSYRRKIFLQIKYDLVNFACYLYCKHVLVLYKLV